MDFVIGHPRGGTHFMSHLLSASGSVIAVHEHLHSLSGFSILESARSYYEGTGDASAIRDLVRMYRLRPAAPIDCNFLLSWILPVLLEEYPDANILHVVRDPRLNVRSCYNYLDCYGDFWESSKTRLEFINWSVTSNKAWMYLVMREIGRFMPAIRGVEGWETLDRFEKNCHFWAEGNRLTLEHAASRPGKYMLVRLEDVASSTDLMLAVFDFLRARPPPLERLQGLTTSRINTRGDALWSAVERIKRETGTALLPEMQLWPDERHSTLKKICSDVAQRVGYAL
jgi:hypothetical protein